jgi:hypothetical protein
MKHAVALLLFCYAIVAITSCKKKEKDEMDTSTATQKTLKAGKWQVVAATMTVNYNGKDTTADVYPEIDECEKDDFIIFSDNSKLTLDQNGIACPGYPQITNYKWGLLDNDTRIYIIDANPDTFGLEVSSTEMKLKHNGLNSQGDTIWHVRTLKNIN